MPDLFRHPFENQTVYMSCEILKQVQDDILYSMSCRPLASGLAPHLQIKPYTCPVGSPK